MAGRHSSAAPEAVMSSSDTTSVMPSTPEKASSTFRVSFPLQSFSSQHKTMRKLPSAREGGGRQSVLNAEQQSLRGWNILNKSLREPHHDQSRDKARDDARDDGSEAVHLGCMDLCRFLHSVRSSLVSGPDFAV